MIPDHLITTATISREIEGQCFDFTVTFTVYGEVLAIANHFLNLPQAAQQLMVGDKIERYKSLIKVNQNLIPYLIPLVKVGCLNEGELATIYKKLVDLNKANCIGKPYIFVGESSLKNWMESLYELVKETEEDEQFFLLTGLVSNNKTIRDSCLGECSNLRKRYPLVGPLILELIPMLSDFSNLKNAYMGLGHSPSIETFQFLSALLKNEKSSIVRDSILYGLSTYISEEVYLLTSDHYYTRQKDTRKCFFLTGAVNLLKHFRTQKSQKILSEICVAEDVKVANAAFKVLQAWGLSDNELANILRPAFKERKSIIQMKSILSNYRILGNKELYPAVDEIIELMSWHSEFDNVKVKMPVIPEFLEGRMKSENFKRLFYLLNFRNKALYESIFNCFERMGKTEHLVPLIQLAGTETFFRESSLFLAISATVKRMKKAPRDIATVLPILRMERYPQAQYMLIMVNIELLKKCPTEIAVTELLLDLNSPFEKVRLKALEAIVQFKDNRISSALKDRLEDKDEKVRKLAEKEYAKIKLLNI